MISFTLIKFVFLNVSWNQLNFTKNDVILCFRYKSIKLWFPRKFLSDRNQCISGTTLFRNSKHAQDHKRLPFHLLRKKIATTGSNYMMYFITMFEKCSQSRWKMYVKVANQKNELAKCLNLSLTIFRETWRNSFFGTSIMDAFTFTWFLFCSGSTI